MSINRYTHYDLLTSDVRQAFGREGRGRGGRILSGLLKAAVKKGQIQVERSLCRVSDSVWYLMTEEQAQAIRAEAIARSKE